MKSNKEKVYDFIRLHADEKADRGISTAYIADAMELQRTNVSSILNLLVQEGRIQKCNGRPVLYKVGREESTLEECFSDLIGADGSLRQTIQLAKAAVLYPQRSLNTLLVGAVEPVRAAWHKECTVLRWNRRFCRKMLRFFTSIATIMQQAEKSVLSRMTAGNSRSRALYFSIIFSF